MNIIRVIKTARKKTESGHVPEEKLDAIPTSQLPGISALPVELWSQVLRGILDPHLQHEKWQCHGLPEILELRLVCHAFDEEIQRALHQRLTLRQLPYRSYLPNLKQLRKGIDISFRNKLLASALYRSIQSHVEEKIKQPIVSRIKNCVLVAQYIDSDHDALYEDQLVRMFCSAASTSNCCSSYIFTLLYSTSARVWQVDDQGSSPGYGSLRAHTELASGRNRSRSSGPGHGDVLLEAALLGANGYKLTEVKRWLLRLGRLGMLRGYRTDSRRTGGEQSDVLIDCPRCGSRHRPASQQISQVITAGGDFEFQRQFEQEVEMEYEALEMLYNGAGHGFRQYCGIGEGDRHVGAGLGEA